MVRASYYRGAIGVDSKVQIAKRRGAHRAGQLLADLQLAFRRNFAAPCVYDLHDCGWTNDGHRRRRCIATGDIDWRVPFGRSTFCRAIFHGRGRKRGRRTFRNCAGSARLDIKENRDARCYKHIRRRCCRRTIGVDRKAQTAKYPCHYRGILRSLDGLADLQLDRLVLLATPCVSDRH